MDWNGTTFRRAHGIGFFPIVDARFMGKEPTEEVVAQCQKETDKLPGLYASFEADLKASGTKFIAGNEISIADFQLYAQATDINYKAMLNSFDDFPLMKAWYERCGQSKGIKEIHEGEGYQERIQFMQGLYLGKK